MRNSVLCSVALARALALALAASACGRQVQVGTASPEATRDPAIMSADQLLDAMHRRHAGSWYRSITFVQKSTYLRPDGTASRVENWYKAGAMPGRLRIDLGDPSKGNGVLYRADSAYSIQNGRIVDRRAARNPLLILGFDVHAQPPARTFEQLRHEGFNLTVLRMDSLDGKRVYVVGAGPGDLTTNQFWVEADRMLFVRMLQTDGRGRTQDVRFGKYAPHGGGWVGEEVRVLVDGRLFFLEEYSNVKVNVAFDENLFIPERWSTASHWYTP